MPWPIGVVVLGLLLAVGFHLWHATALAPEVGTLAAAGIAAVGLIRGWRWVYAVTLVFGAFQVLKFLPIDPVTALMNFLLVSLVAASRRYFFPRSHDSVEADAASPGARIPDART